jgi:Uncharacterized protein conserved in bacteria (DUF2066)
MPSRQKRLALLTVLLAFLATAPFSARAQGALDTFTVRDVDVDVTAPNVTAAKNQAIADGQRQAFQMLLERLTSPADHARLPKVDGANFVRDFAIEQERSSATRYLATLTVRFNPAAIRKLLRDSNLSFTETRARAIVVVPVLKAQGKLVLWEDPNPWRTAWTALNGGGLVPLVVPPGDVADIQTITAEQALAVDVEKLTAEGARWHSGDVLVAAAALSADGRHLDVSLTGLPGTPKPFETVAYDLQSGETADQMMGRAARDLGHALDAGYKQTTMLQYDKSEALSTIVPLSGLDDWLAVRDRLGRIPQVRSYEVVSLSRAEAALVVHVAGDPEKARNAMADAGLRLEWSNGFWTMRPPGTR